MSPTPHTQLFGGASVRGAAHKIHNMPNQDAFGGFTLGKWTVIAVSDGHGAAAHYRSDRGARFAVDAVRQAFEELLVDEISSLANIEKFRSALQHLPDRIVTLWRGLVATDVIADPVAGQDGADEQIAYGATCLAACLGLDFSFYAQIGDGDLVAMKVDGTLVKPLPDDKGLVGEQTYSLCQPDAAKRFRTLFQLAPQDLAVPEFVLAATDGLAKSFSKDSQFFDVVRQLAKLSSDRGIQALSKDLELWLSEVSEHGSGDDITLMIFKDSRDRVFSKMQLTGWEYMIEKLQRLLR